MKPGSVWVGRTLSALGLVMVLIGVSRGGRWTLFGAAAGAVMVLGLTFTILIRFWWADRPGSRPLDFEHMIDLLRRAHGARAGWVVGLRRGDAEVVVSRAGGVTPEGPVRERGAALVRLASVDGRAHVAREEAGTFVAVGDFPYGAGLLLTERDAAPERTQGVAEDLRRLIGSMRLAEVEVSKTQGELVARRLSLVAAGAQTLEAIARAGAELAQQVTQRGVAVVVRESGGGDLQVVAISSATDRRLTGRLLAPGSPVERAVQSGLPVVTAESEDVFGSGMPERRRRERAGTAYPLVDGHFVIGALVLIGGALEPEHPAAEQIGRLVVELGPRLAAARAVHDAEQRAVRDPLTGLNNRREFEQIFSRSAGPGDGKPRAVTLIYVDLDRFKQLNDTLGHAAGDAALRHVAAILEQQIRDGDLVARIGGEEFALWLPETPLDEGVEVAERVRRAIEASVWRWNGERRALTASCGVASYPVPVPDLNNLRVMADSALYKAKQAGRNRVEKAGSAD